MHCSAGSFYVYGDPDQTKIHGKVSTEADFSQREGVLNRMDIFNEALDKLNTDGRLSFNIASENSNYESKKFHES